ncbi:D-alanyl-lipoteichoic acid acyltransferase DltB, MBOAT superfamily [Flavobacteriaceae bacterium MAR_2010_188]|nr:D-alanyl-lipoteichoic acid acyltransferase DltB, MBOAT superfamily [Flavobacteriaceae bacterium MAR_2010_188]
MLFNSIEFAIFLPIVFCLYWAIGAKNLKLQNIFLLVASYFFYAFWDWRFLGLILFSTIVDFVIGILLSKSESKKHRKILLWTSILINLGLLGYFKYSNFFLENFVQAFTLFGSDLRYSSLYIILPVGISFYTFQTLSYTIDIYRNKISPTKDFIVFATFVSFFPQLVAGPIERASHLLPQFLHRRKFKLHKSIDGLRQILWGLFKKMVIADNCAKFVDEFFANYQEYSGSTLLLGAFFFTVQIYCDFSGYSDIAIGTSRLFGFDLMKNFNFPYFSRSIGEFWRRWHISLTSWFKDYVYIPLGGSWGSKAMQIRNTLLIFLIIGLWHGAHWKFVVYGLINALHFLPLIIFGTNYKYRDTVAEGKWFPSPFEFFNMLKTFAFLVLVRVFFRADDLTSAIDYLSIIFSKSLLMVPQFNEQFAAFTTLIFIFIFFILEWQGRTKEYAIEKLGLSWPRPLRWTFYYALVFCIFYFKGDQQEFIYFQF